MSVRGSCAKSTMQVRDRPRGCLLRVRDRLRPANRMAVCQSKVMATSRVPRIEARPRLAAWKHVLRGIAVPGLRVIRSSRRTGGLDSA